MLRNHFYGKNLLAGAAAVLLLTCGSAQASLTATQCDLAPSHPLDTPQCPTGNILST